MILQATQDELKDPNVEDLKVIADSSLLNKIPPEHLVIEMLSVKRNILSELEKPLATFEGLKQMVEHIPPLWNKPLQKFLIKKHIPMEFIFLEFLENYIALLDNHSFLTSTNLYNIFQVPYHNLIVLRQNNLITRKNFNTESLFYGKLYQHLFKLLEG